MTIPTNLFMWLLAFLPIIVLLVLMIGLQWGATEAAPIGLVITVVTGIVFYKADIKLVAIESAKGVWSALSIFLIIWTAVLMYQVGNEVKAFLVIRNGMRKLLPNELLLIIAMGWIFESFLQGITGFGVPVAVGAPLLIGIGVNPLWAVIIPLLGQSWGNTFGTLAAAWDGLAMSAGITSGSGAYWKTALWAALFLLLWNLVIGIAICWFYGKGKGLKKGLLAVLIMSLIQGGGQLALSQVNTTLACFIPACISLLVLLLVGKLKMYRDEWSLKESRIMSREEGKAKDHPGMVLKEDKAKDHPGMVLKEDKAKEYPGMVREEVKAEEYSGMVREKDKAKDVSDMSRQEGNVKKGSENIKSMTLLQAFVPYIVLSVLTLTVLLVKPLNQFLGQFSLGVSFPETATGYGFVNAAVDKYSPLHLFTHASMFLFISSIVGILYYQVKGEMKTGGVRRIFAKSIAMTMPSGMAIIGLVVMSKVMSGTGQTVVLANGIANVLGKAYVVLAPFVGLLGTFMTGSNMSSNILFGDFQTTTAGLLHVNSAAVAGAQTAGGSIGSAVSPSNIVLGTTTARILGSEGKVLKKLLAITVPAVLVVGCIVFILVGL